MEVLIVSKTHMSSMSCVGGLVLSNNRNIRLMNPDNYNQPGDTSFEVGDIWDIEFNNRADLHPPHIEDVIIKSKSFRRKQNVLDTFLRSRRLINWSGHIDTIFDGKLHWTNSGSGYITEVGDFPGQSVGFWQTNKDLHRTIFNSKTRFRFPNGNNYRSATFVGYQETIEIIPAGTIIRVSLSRIFPKDGSEITAPRGYYLQFSGWYQKLAAINHIPDPEPEDDLPW